MVQDATDETTFSEEPSAAASWGKEEKSESFPASDGKEGVASTPEPVAPQNSSEASIGNETEVSGSESSSDAKGGAPSSVPATKASERLAKLPYESLGRVPWLPRAFQNYSNRSDSILGTS